jgi:hypothetical protein
MSKTLRTSLILGLALGICLPAHARRSSKVEGEADPQVTIRVYDYSGLEAELLSRAMDYAAHVYGRSGVEVGLVLCRVSGSNSSDEVCRQGPKPTSFQLRIVSNPERQITGTDDLTLGYAAGPLITVFYPRVEELAALSAVGPDEILGCVVAHELGHVLLGSNAHSPTGIMSACWGEAELRLVHQNALGFLPFQKELIRINVLARQQESLKQAGTVALAQR